MEKTDIICTCLGLSVGDIEDAIEGGATDLDSIMETTQAGTICGACVSDIEDIIEASK